MLTFHLAAWVELNTKIFEQFVAASAGDGDGVIVDGVDWFSDVDDGKIFHLESHS